MIISELIKLLQDMAQDSRVSVAHLFRAKSGGLRQMDCDILGVNPVYDQDTNKLINYTIVPNLKLEDIK